MEGLIFSIQKFSLHDGAGIRTAVFFQGCNMNCGWCANPESLELHPINSDSNAKYYTVGELMKELIKDKPFYDASGGGITLTGGEPLLQWNFVCALCDVLRNEDIGVVLETSANVPGAVFQKTLDKLEAIYIDLKHYDDHTHRQGTGVGMTQILSNIKIALESDVHTTIRIPVIPDFNNSNEDILGFLALLGKLGVHEVHLLPFHQLGEHKYQKLGLKYEYAGVAGLRDEDLEPFAKLLEAAGFVVQIGG